MPAVEPADVDDEVPPGVPGESVTVRTNGVELHAVEAGPADGDLVVLLHGFPEFWYGWHEAVAPLAEEGYRVVVPDQRGYNLSDRPEGVRPYHIGELAGDVVGLVDAYDREEAAVVGHDWGAAVAWWTALHHPDRLDSLVAVNVPHPTVMRDTLRRSWRQRLRSWYFLGFQVPEVPERLARVGDWRPVVESMRRSSRPGTFSAADFDRYRRAWSRPGAFTAMVNWYRAMVRLGPEPATTTVEVPTLVAWGARDRFLEQSMARESLDYCEDGDLLTLRDATHWVQHEEPERVVDAIVDHVHPVPAGTAD